MGDTMLEVRAGELHRHAEFREEPKPSKRAITVERDPEPCPTDKANVHLQTSKGHWCISKEAIVYV